MPLTDKLTAVADAIRQKAGTSDRLTLDQMPAAIAGLSSGGWDVQVVLGNTSPFFADGVFHIIPGALTYLEPWYYSEDTSPGDKTKVYFQTSASGIYFSDCTGALFQGDDCSNSAFIPVGDMPYTITYARDAGGALIATAARCVISEEF